MCVKNSFMKDNGRIGVHPMGWLLADQKVEFINMFLNLLESMSSFFSNIAFFNQLSSSS